MSKDDDAQTKLEEALNNQYLDMQNTDRKDKDMLIRNTPE